MSRKIDNEVIQGIIDSFKSDMIDSDIAGKFGVSASYVNKLRNSQKRLEEKSKSIEKLEQKEYSIIDSTSTLDEIGLLELKINSLKQTIKWYEELLDFKKKSIKAKNQK